MFQRNVLSAPLGQKVEIVYFSETSVFTYGSMLCYNQKEHKFYHAETRFVTL
jgi:hypothetical protein